MNFLNLKIGCGAIKFPDGSLTKVIVVCQYAPAPNFRNQNVYEIGRPCSSCSSTCKDGALCVTATGT